MPLIPDQSKRDLWTQRLNRFHNSGLPIAHFCRHEKISQHSFYYWAKRIPRSEWTVREDRRRDPEAIVNVQTSMVLIRFDEQLQVSVPADCPETICRVVKEFISFTRDVSIGRGLTSTSPPSEFQRVIVRPQAQSPRS
jgi:hypothetical protein